MFPMCFWPVQILLAFPEQFFCLFVFWFSPLQDNFMDVGVCSNRPVHVINVSMQTGLSVTLETMKRKAYLIKGKKWQVSLWESLCKWHPPTNISLLLIFLSFMFQGHLKNWIRRENCRLCLSVGNYINLEVCNSGPLVLCSRYQDFLDGGPGKCTSST